MPLPLGSREICKCCGEINRVGFAVENYIWSMAVPFEWRTSVLCIGCFTRFADEAGVLWDTDIKFYPVSFITHSRGETDAARPFG